MKGIWCAVALAVSLAAAPGFSAQRNSAQEGPYFTPPSPIGATSAGTATIVTASVVQQPIIAPPGAPILEPLPETEPVPYCNECQLFECVRYRNLKAVAPCAVEMIVAVKTPCGCKKDPCRPCVNVKICVPQCDCPTVKIRKHGNKVIYDYGKYEIALMSKNGEVIVTYHRGIF